MCNAGLPRKYVFSRVGRSTPARLGNVCTNTSMFWYGQGIEEGRESSRERIYSCIRLFREGSCGVAERNIIGDTYGVQTYVGSA